MEGLSRSASPPFPFDMLEDIATGVKNSEAGCANGQALRFSQNGEKIHVPYQTAFL